VLSTSVLILPSFFLVQAGEGDLFDFGQECLDRAALSLGANTVAASAGALLPVLLADGDWKRRHAALITIAQVCGDGVWAWQWVCLVSLAGVAGR
jgi:hypothetical protein